MSVNPATKIFFFKSNPMDLLAVENYLKKRDYNVLSEYDLKEALVKLIPFNPDYVFIAWDHSHERIHTIPRFISQSITAKIIPYIQSNSKEHYRGLETSGFPHRIFPPISGPGVIRTILKIEKEEAQKSIARDKEEFESAKLKESSMNYIAGQAANKERLKIFLDEMDKSSSMAGNQTAQENLEKKSSLHIQKGTRGELLKMNQSKLKTFAAKNLDQKLKTALKDDFESTIKNKILDMAQTTQDDSIAMASEYSIQPEKKSSNDSSRTPDQDVDTSAHVASKNIDKVNLYSVGYKKLLCLIVQSESWCGYLLIASQLTINNQDYQIILQEWLQNQFVNMSDIDENDLFEVNLELTDDLHIKNWAQEKADYLELVDVDDQEVLVSFFSIDPKSLVLDANDTFEMLGVPLNIISTDKKSSLSLFLHLPDNKKFILYTPAQQILSSQQKIKLAEKSVEKLYTPLDFQKELNKMKAEDYLNHSVKLIRKVALI